MLVFTRPNRVSASSRRAMALLCLSAAIPLRGSAEIVCALGPNASSYNAYQDQRPSPDAMELAGQVNAAFRPVCRPACPQIALFRNATAPNVMLVATPSGDAKIVYSPQFFTDIYEAAGDGAIIAVVAHELGHALSETVPAAWMKTSWTSEIRADAWAGCALATANLSARALRNSVAALERYPAMNDPGWNARLPGLRTGYLHCGGDSGRFTQAVTADRK